MLWGLAGNKGLQMRAPKNMWLPGFSLGVSVSHLDLILFEAQDPSAGHTWGRGFRVRA